MTAASTETGKMRALFKAMVATAAVAAPLYANAIPVTFDLAGGSKSAVEVTNFSPSGGLGGLACLLSGCGVDASLVSNLGSQQRALNVDESWTFDFFNLDFHGVGSGSGQITASLGFDLPSGAPNAGGDGFGSLFTLGFITLGSLDWATNDYDFLLGDGTAYRVSLNDLSGITGGSATVTGTITLRSGPGTIKVPEPTTLGLFGIGLLALGLMGRRRRT